MKAIMIVLTLLSALYGCYFGLIAVLGLLKGKKTRPDVKPKYRVCALIAARNEANVIDQAVRSLQKQNYPAELSAVVVAANNCTDDTAARARAAGATVIELTGEIRGKGDALRLAFSRLRNAHYDAYVVLDADNLADGHLFQAVNNALCDGVEIAQGYRDSKNPGDGWVAGSTSVFYWFMSSLYNRARSAIGMSCSLNGTGFMVSAALVSRMGWNTRSLTEDLEFTAQCALEGVKVGWMEDGVVYDDQPTGLRDSMTQRRRWFAGSLQCFRRYFGKLLRRGMKQSLDMCVLFFGTMLQWIGLIPMGIGVALCFTEGGGWPAFGVFAGLGLFNTVFWCDLGALLICLLEKKKFAGRWKTVLLFGAYIVTWMPANLSVFLLGAPKWKPIAHKPVKDA